MGLRLQAVLPAVVLTICTLIATSYANVPADLTNFQNQFACDHSTLIVWPRNLDDVAEAVRLHDHVRANGEGHSWNQPFFCAASEQQAKADAAAQSAASGGADAKPTPASGRKLLQQQQQGPVAGTPLPASADANNGTATSTGSTPPGPKPRSANIAMTSIRPLNITVNETEASVWVDAGVKVIDLLQYLANNVTPNAPAGYTLGAFPWFVYQTVAGAVATGTHGSHMGPHKSMSNQVMALDVILANGTRQVFTNETHPFIMRALRVSVGKLGILGRVKLQIVPEVPVHRSLKALTSRQFLELVTSAQEAVMKGDGPPAWMNETQIFWLPQTQQFMMVGFTRADSDDPAAAQAALAGYVPDNTTVFTRKGDVLALGELSLPADAALSVKQSQVLLTAPAEVSSLRDTEPYAAAQRWLDGFLESTVNSPLAGNLSSDSAAARTEGTSWNIPTTAPPAAAYVINNSANNMLALSAAGINFVAGNLSAEATSIYIKQPITSLPTIRGVLYDQYEVSTPLKAMGDCWRKVLETVHEGDIGGTNATQRARDKGLRTAALIRFVGVEEGLLSHKHDGPRMYINLKDYVFYNANKTINKPFKAIIAVLTGDPACASQGPPRLHWGKAGWPDRGCWHGDHMYGGNWCHFGCAVQQLDPTGKFADSAADRWTWAGVSLQKCCGEEGFRVGAPGCECKLGKLIEHAFGLGPTSSLPLLAIALSTDMPTEHVTMRSNLLSHFSASTQFIHKA